MKSARIFFFSVIFAFLTLSILVAQPIEQSLARLFSYDPHPATARFAEQAPYNGELVDIEVRFKESWKENKEAGNIDAISFTVSALKNNVSIASAETRQFKVSPAMKKGENMGEATLGNIKFKAILDSFEKDAKGVTDLTVIFTISYDSSLLDNAKAAAAKKETASSMGLCTSLASKADALPTTEKNILSKLSLYKKALMAAPSGDSSPAAAAFRKQVEAKISALNGENPIDAAPMVAKDIKCPEPVIMPKNENPAGPALTDKTQIKPEAIQLYNQAKTLFAQNKGPEAREALRKSLEISPDYYDALILLGENAFDNRKFSRAKEAFGKALDLNDSNSDTMLKYFKACYYMGEGSEAIEKLQIYKNKYPQSNSIKLTLSEAYFQMGDLPNARQLCDEVLKSEPANYRAKDLSKRIDRLMK